MRRQKQMDPEELDRPEWNSLLANYSKHDIGEAYFQGRLEQMGYHVEHWGIDKRHQDDHLIFDNKMDLRIWEPMDGQTHTPDTWPEAEVAPYIFAAQEDTDFDIPQVVPAGAEGMSEPATYGEVRWELRAVADVKTKSNPDWLGKFNLRHLAHYAEWASRYDVPVFIYMTMVDEEAESVGEPQFVTPITTDWSWAWLVDNYDPESDVDLSYGDLKDSARECDIVRSSFRAPDGNMVVEIEADERYDFDHLAEDVL